MKRLILVRHAKSSWKQPHLNDHDRPLNKRGERNRHQLAHWLDLNGPALDAIHSSTAVRARLTAEAIANSLLPVVLTEDLYTFAVADLVHYVRELPPQLETVALVSHNPALTELLQWLAPDPIDNLPTASAAQITLAINHWPDLETQSGQRDWLLRAREL